jgi:hypothetical protein
VRVAGALRLAAAVVACGLAGVSAQEPNTRGTRLLFIGNSYTYFNNLPAIVQRLGEAAGVGPVDVRMVAPGGMRLEDHWRAADAHTALREGPWDVVVLQEQSTLGVDWFLDGRTRVSTDEVFAPAVDRWVGRVREAGARPVLYLTWARKATREDQAGLNRAYGRAARRTGAEVAPVGLAWQRSRSGSPEVELYADDGSHPAPAGSYLAASTLVARVFGKSPVGLPGQITGPPVDLQTGQVKSLESALLVRLDAGPAHALQRAAHASLDDWDREPTRTDDVPMAGPVPSPLPASVARGAGDFTGTWRGTMRLHPGGPLDLTLRVSSPPRVARDAHAPAPGVHVEVRPAAGGGPPPEQPQATGVALANGELSFSVALASLDGTEVALRSVLATRNTLRGIAEATWTARGRSARLLGTFDVRRKERAARR